MQRNDSGLFQGIPDSDIERFIEEDVPYGDLTTHLLGIGKKAARMVFSTREETTLCCTEEAGRVARNFGAFVTRMMPTDLCCTEEAGRVARNFGAFVTRMMPTGTLVPAETANVGLFSLRAQLRIAESTYWA